MSLTRTTGAAILTPEEVGSLLVEPTINLCEATNAATVIQTGNAWFRLPIISADPSAAWLNEGDEIPATDATLNEVDVHFAKLAGLSVVSNELAQDSSPEASQAIGEGLARDLARKLDAAFFGAEVAPAPAGIASLTGTNLIDVSSGGVKNLDPFLAAQSNAETLGTTVGSFVASPADALALAQLKQYTSANSNVPLLQSDPTQPTRRLIGGVPLLVSAGVAAGAIWAIPKDRANIIVRLDATVEADASVFFTSDRVAVRAIMRCGFAFPQPAAISKIKVA